MSGRIDDQLKKLRLIEDYELQFEDPIELRYNREYADHLSLTEIYDDEVNLHD